MKEGKKSGRVRRVASVAFFATFHQSQLHGKWVAEACRTTSHWWKWPCPGTGSQSDEHFYLTYLHLGHGCGGLQCFNLHILISARKGER